MNSDRRHFPPWISFVAGFFVLMAGCFACPTTNNILGTHGWLAVTLFPTPPGAYNIEMGADTEFAGWGKGFTVDTNAEEVKAFYFARFRNAGWTVESLEETITLSNGSTKSHCLSVQNPLTSAHIWILQDWDYETGAPVERSMVSIDIAEARSFCEDKFDG